MPTFISRHPSPVTAFRFDGTLQSLDDICSISGYVAVMLGETLRIHCEDRDVVLNIGDWAVQEQGCVVGYTNGDFESAFAPVNDKTCRFTLRAKDGGTESLDMTCFQYLRYRCRAAAARGDVPDTSAYIDEWDSAYARQRSGK